MLHKPKRRRRFVLIGIALLAVCGMSIIGGAVGGAIGAVWIIQNMGKDKVPSAVVSYDGLPKEGVRPADIAGIYRNNLPINPCVIPFLEANADIIGKADWTKVRIHPNFKGRDVINDIAFARGVAGITRKDDIYIAIPKNLSQLNEELFFHELTHVAQYSSGMDLPAYAASAASSYGSGARPEDNQYEEFAKISALKMARLWKNSPERGKCHPDLQPGYRYNSQRALSEMPIVQYAEYSTNNSRYVITEIQLHKSGKIAGTVLKKPPVTTRENKNNDRPNYEPASESLG